MKRVAILGTRGIPASHGGFETFAENLSLHLVDRGWEVTVYCQAEGGGSSAVDDWNGVRRIHVPAAGGGPGATIVFDWRATRHAAREPGLKLVLGYNTAVFNALLRLRGRPVVTNMDGIEWRRSKWGAMARTWFYLNERLGCLLSDRLVADHPAIEDHLATRVGRSKITMIPYGARRLRGASEAPLEPLGLRPRRYLLVIARIEPENSILEIVRAFSSERRGVSLVVLGGMNPESHRYHREVSEAAGEEVIFPGAIYDKTVVDALRVHATAYVHGHTVGGTNPSLVEALGAGSAVVAQDNVFNRWVAGEGAAYFRDRGHLAGLLGGLLADPDRLHRMRGASRERFEERFTWERVLGEYERLLEAHLDG